MAAAALPSPSLHGFECEFRRASNALTVAYRPSENSTKEAKRIRSYEHDHGNNLPQF